MALVEKYKYSSTGYVLFSQNNHITVFILLQEVFAKGGISMWIFRAWITGKDGSKIYAKDHGKKAFRFWVGPGPEPDKKKNQ